MELVGTDDGSFTLRDQQTDELYHNSAGAYTEALVTYIQPSGLLERASTASDLVVLDACFGLGYNTFVFLAELIALGAANCRFVKVIAIEKDEAVLNVVPQILEYPKFDLIREAVVSTGVNFADNAFSLGNGVSVLLRLVHGDIRNEVPRLALSGELDCDAVFHDAFSPKRVPELWTFELFQNHFSLLKNRSGRVLTYSSAPAVRGAMRDAGFHVRRSTALGRKTGGTVGTISDAAKISSPFIHDLSSQEKTKLASASGVPYRDPTYCDPRPIIQARRTEERLNWRSP